MIGFRIRKICRGQTNGNVLKMKGLELVPLHESKKQSTEVGMVHSGLMAAGQRDRFTVCGVWPFEEVVPRGWSGRGWNGRFPVKRGRNDRFTGSDSNVLAAQLDRGWWERLEWEVSSETGSQ